MTQISDQTGGGATYYVNGQFTADRWLKLDDDAPFPDDVSNWEGVIVSLERFLGDELASAQTPLGVFLRAGDKVESLEERLDRVTTIVVEFPKFSDGRGYSAARILREQFDFSGEIRAAGEVLLDQIPLMRRCGVTAFEVRHEPTRRALIAGHSSEVTLYLQPVEAVKEVPAGTRPWARRPAA